MYDMPTLTHVYIYANTLVQVHAYVKASGVFFNRSLFNEVGSLPALLTEAGFIAEPGAHLFS